MKRKYKQIIAVLVALLLPFQGIGSTFSFAQATPSSLVSLSPAFNPAVLRGVKVDPQNPFHFNFVLDNGQSRLAGDELKAEGTKLIKYFLASLTLPENDLWVNLSPYEKDRIITNEFGQTEMGRQLLSEDYLLKKLSASLLHPDSESGKKFWDKVRKATAKKLGTNDIPVDTFNRIWVMPAKAVVYQNQGTAFIGETHLKVLLEEDYVAQSKQKDASESTTKSNSSAGKQDFSTQVFRDEVLPIIEKEVNEGESFASLRQIYHSLILASWYKRTLKQSLLSQIYVDQKKVAGMESDDKDAKQRIYNEYLETFKKGVYNLIREEEDVNTGEMIPRKYFSGGVTLLTASAATILRPLAEAPRAGFGQLVVLDTAAQGVDAKIAASSTVTPMPLDVNDLLGSEFMAAIKALNGGNNVQVYTTVGSYQNNFAKIQEWRRENANKPQDEYIFLALRTHYVAFGQRGEKYDYRIIAGLRKEIFKRSDSGLIDVNVEFRSIDLGDFDLVRDFSVYPTERIIHLDQLSLGKKGPWYSSRDNTIPVLRGQGFADIMSSRLRDSLAKAYSGFDVVSVTVEEDYKAATEFKVAPHLMSKYYGATKLPANSPQWDTIRRLNIILPLQEQYTYWAKLPEASSAGSALTANEVKSISQNMLQVLQANDALPGEIDDLVVLGFDNFDVFRDVLRSYQSGLGKRIAILGGFGRITVSLVLKAVQNGYEIEIADGRTINNDNLAQFKTEIAAVDHPQKVIKYSEANIIKQIMQQMVANESAFSALKGQLNDSDFLLEERSPFTTANLENYRTILTAQGVLSAGQPLRILYTQSPHQQLRSKANFDHVFSEQIRNGQVQGFSHVVDYDLAGKTNYDLAYDFAGEAWRFIVQTGLGYFDMKSSQYPDGIDSIPDDFWTDAQRLFNNISDSEKQILKQQWIGLWTDKSPGSLDKRIAQLRSDAAQDFANTILSASSTITPERRRELEIELEGRYKEIADYRLNQKAVGDLWITFGDHGENFAYLTHLLMANKLTMGYSQNDDDAITVFLSEEFPGRQNDRVLRNQLQTLIDLFAEWRDPVVRKFIDNVAAVYVTIGYLIPPNRARSAIQGLVNPQGLESKGILDLASGLNFYRYVQNANDGTPYYVVDKSYYVKSFLEKTKELYALSNVTIMQDDILRITMPVDSLGTIRIKNVETYVQNFNAVRLKEMTAWLSPGGQVLFQMYSNRLARGKFLNAWDNFITARVAEGWGLTYIYEKDNADYDVLNSVALIKPAPGQNLNGAVQWEKFKQIVAASSGVRVVFQEGFKVSKLDDEKFLPMIANKLVAQELSKSVVSEGDIVIFENLEHKSWKNNIYLLRWGKKKYLVKLQNQPYYSPLLHNWDVLQEIHRDGIDPDIAQPIILGRNESVPGQDIRNDYMVTDYFDGEDFLERFNNAPLKEKDAVSLILKVMQIVARLHAKGIVVADLRADNIRLRMDGTPALYDFDISEKNSASFNKDTAALGDVLFFLLVGQNLTPSELTDRSSVNLVQNKDLLSIINKAISKQYINIGDMVTDLGKVQEQLGGTFASSAATQPKVSLLESPHEWLSEELIKEIQATLNNGQPLQYVNFEFNNEKADDKTQEARFIETLKGFSDDQVIAVLVKGNFMAGAHPFQIVVDRKAALINSRNIKSVLGLGINKIGFNQFAFAESFQVFENDKTIFFDVIDLAQQWQVQGLDYSTLQTAAKSLRKYFSDFYLLSEPDNPVVSRWLRENLGDTEFDQQSVEARLIIERTRNSYLKNLRLEVEPEVVYDIRKIPPALRDSIKPTTNLAIVPGEQAKQQFQSRDDMKEFFKVKKGDFTQGWFIAFDVDKGGVTLTTEAMAKADDSFGELNQLLLAQFSPRDGKFFGTLAATALAKVGQKGMEEGFVYVPANLPAEQLKKQLDDIREVYFTKSGKSVSFAMIPATDIVTAVSNGDGLVNQDEFLLRSDKASMHLEVVENVLEKLLRKAKGPKGAVYDEKYGNKVVVYSDWMGKLDDAILAASSGVSASENSQAGISKDLGGIDLREGALDLDLRGDAGTFQMPADPAQIRNIHIDGLVPVILNVNPLPSLPAFLNLSEAETVPAAQLSLQN